MYNIKIIIYTHHTSCKLTWRLFTVITSSVIQVYAWKSLWIWILFWNLILVQYYYYICTHTTCILLYTYTFINILVHHTSVTYYYIMFINYFLLFSFMVYARYTSPSFSILKYIRLYYEKFSTIYINVLTITRSMKYLKTMSL